MGGRRPPLLFSSSLSLPLDSMPDARRHSIRGVGPSTSGVGQGRVVGGPRDLAELPAPVAAVLPRSACGDLLLCLQRLLYSFATWWSSATAGHDWLPNSGAG
jgi:hypothetical protein